MKIVIDIDEYLYCEIQAYKTVYESHIGEIVDAICKGIPLIEGDNRLVNDAIEIIDEIGREIE